MIIWKRSYMRTAELLFINPVLEIALSSARGGTCPRMSFSNNGVSSKLHKK